MRRVLLVLAAVAFLAGCGTQHHANPNTPIKTTLPTGKPGLRFKEPNGTTCATRNPPQASECIEQAMRAEGKRLTLTAPTVTSHRQCADWSQWQGWYPNTASLHCVIIQAAYGLNMEPSLREQVRDARNHGLPYGVYNFGEPGVSGSSEMAYTHALEPHAPLGYWFDAEVSGVFWRSCEFTGEAQDLGLRIFGVFSYPGGYVAGGGEHCAGYLWPSEWQVPGPYAFGGYPQSAIKLWQYTGTGSRFGVETDLDVDEGLIALASPPKPKPKPKPPTPSQLRRELQADLRLRTTLRALEAKHECRNPPERHPVPNTAAYRHACWGVWVEHGRKTDATIRGLERALQ